MKTKLLVAVLAALTGVGLLTVVAVVMLDNEPEQATNVSVQDVPRLNGVEARAIIIEYKDAEGRRGSCSPAELKYSGHGIWDCGAWLLDETTGVVFRKR